MPDLGLYIHIPFCARKCPYCDFSSYADCEQLFDPYVGAVLTELRRRRADLGDARFRTVYVGGGTPTLLPVRQLSRLLTGVMSAVSVSADAEVTVEANPGTIQPGKLKALRRLGANRLSLGVQSFRDEDLQVLGRIHTAAEAESGFREARAAGFENVGIDLIYAIPEQSPADWRLCLERAIALGPEHVSAYALTLEEHTPLADMIRSGCLSRVAEGRELRLYSEARRLLRGGGYGHYEISNFARPGRMCEHNLRYWRCEPYLGIGAAAHSHLGGARSANVRDPTAYIWSIARKGRATDWEERLPPERAVGEAIMLGLRLREGVPIAPLEDRFHIDVRRRFAEEIAELRGAGLLKADRKRLAVTARGLALADEVALRFIDVQAPGPTVAVRLDRESSGNGRQPGALAEPSPDLL